MKQAKKLLALLLVAVLVISLGSLTAFAADDDAVVTTGTLTVQNSAKGEYYKVFKVFGATLSETKTDAGEAQSIAYTYEGDLPTTLADAFEKIEGSNYVVKKKDVSDEAVLAAVKAYADTLEDVTAANGTEGNGGALEFKNLVFGYYIVKTTHGNSEISVDSLNPNAVVYDKNSTTPGANKEVDKDDVSIGDTVTYTATFTTANYIGSGDKAEKVYSYTIKDTLPSFLENVTIKSVVINKVSNEGADVEKVGEYTTLDDKAFPAAGFTIPWVDDNGNSLYPNGAQIVLTYTAKVTAQATVGGSEDEKTFESGNINTVELIPNKDNDEPFEDTYKDSEKIYTYATALQKVDENKKPLAGAKFKVYGLTATGEKGVYTVSAYDPNGTAANLNNYTELECDSEGQLVILGFSSEVSPKIVETEAPNGYNKMNDELTLTVTKTSEEVKASETTIYYDADGHVTDQVTSTSYQKTTYNVDLLKTAVVVVNQKGTELPSTGGIGTTIFYVVGGLLLVGAGVLLVTKKRVGNDG